MLRRPAPHVGEGIVQTKPKGLDHLSRHLHQMASEAHASEAIQLLKSEIVEMEYKQVKKLTPARAAYLAGLIDGEGTVTLSRRNRNKQRELVVSVSNTEMPILKYVQIISGVGKITKKRTTSSAHTPSFTYQVTNRQALGLLKQIARYMHSHKASRAKLVLKDYIRLTPRNGRYTIEQLQEQEKFIERFFAIQSTNCL